MIDLTSFNLGIKKIKVLLDYQYTNCNEKRNYLRIKDHIPFKIKINSTMISGLIINLSENGLCFTSKSDIVLKSGTGLIKQLYPPIRIIINIIWKEKINSITKYGVSFKKISKKNRQYIQNIIRNRIAATHIFIESLTRYIEFLQTIEIQIANKNIFDRQVQELVKRNNEHILLIADLLEQSIYSYQIKKDLKNYFRDCVGEYIYKSKIIHHMFIKPHGYPGDFKLFEMFYNKKPLSQGIGYYFDQFALNHPLCIAIINRKNILKNLSKEFIENNYSSYLDILYIGYGSSKQIEDLFYQYTPNKKFSITCIDWDNEAIKSSKKELQGIYPNINFINQNIFKLLFGKNNDCIIKKRNLVFCSAFANYLYDCVLEKYLKFCWNLVAPGGKLIIAYMNHLQYQNHLAVRWFADWEIYLRDKNEVLILTKSILKNYSIEIIWEETRHIFITILTKKS